MTTTAKFPTSDISRLVSFSLSVLWLNSRRDLSSRFFVRFTSSSFHARYSFTLSARASYITQHTSQQLTFNL